MLRPGSRLGIVAVVLLIGCQPVAPPADAAPGDKPVGPETPPGTIAKPTSHVAVCQCWCGDRDTDREAEEVTIPVPAGGNCSTEHGSLCVTKPAKNKLHLGKLNGCMKFYVPAESKSPMSTDGAGSVMDPGQPENPRPEVPNRPVEHASDPVGPAAATDG